MKLSAYGGMLFVVIIVALGAILVPLALNAASGNIQMNADNPHDDNHQFAGGYNFAKDIMGAGSMLLPLIAIVLGAMLLFGFLVITKKWIFG